MIPRILAATAVTASLILGSTVAASADAVTDRQSAMKNMGAMAKTVGDMLRGNTEFNAEAANAAIVKAHDGLVEFATYFPEGSAGGESKAGPMIWEDPAGFAAAIEKVQGDLNDAVAANPQTKEELQAVFQQVGSNCQACHEKYRLPD